MSSLDDVDNTTGTMHILKKGDFVTFDGLLAVIVGTEADASVPEDHVALWHGAPETKRLSAGGTGQAELTPVVWTVPLEHCRPAPPPCMQH
eukprot:TRINITY_DN15435_c0_g1_i1.p2 TRINITY_DN15435_c0_g1~~TRINITY_DN15435_c0_g1_i1.p2  ORF type:complete len:106 (-),score=2.87 TRINITY_DN15435_c0_g1_i1:51-323(-)